jgi:hypothetical protein
VIESIDLDAAQERQLAEPAAVQLPHIRRLLERADQALRLSAAATLEAERRLAPLESDPALRALDQERTRLREEVEALRREREVIRADIEQIVQQGLARRRELQLEVDRLESRAQALLDGVNALGLQMLEAIQAARVVDGALPAPAPRAMAAPSEPARPRQHAWLRPTLTVTGTALGLSVLAWCTGLPTALAQAPWLH